MAQVRSIGVLLPQSMGYSGGVLRGVLARCGASIRAHVTELDHASTILDQGLSGVIAHCSDPTAAAAVMQACTDRHLPLVNTSHVFDLPLPRVGVDDLSAGRLAAEHLIGRGLRHLAVAGVGVHLYSERRIQGFVAEAARLGIPCQRRRAPPGPDSEESGNEAVARWICALPRPVGLFIPSDGYARSIVHQLAGHAVRIPEDVAVIGCDDDDLICDCIHPKMSSVRVDAVRIGVEAFALLEHLMAGGEPPAQPILIPPLGVTVRASTDLARGLAPELVAALDYIAGHVARRIQVQDIADAVHLSRSTLERRFRQALGRTPLEEVVRQRLDLAQRLLIEGESTVAAVAKRCGFSDADQLTGHFQRAFASTPAEFRSAHR